MNSQASSQINRMRSASKMVRQQEQWHYPADLLLEAADTIEALRAELDELHEEFECERCEHNVHHREPRGDRSCTVAPGEGVEFCTFIICGRCSNEQHARYRRDRDELRAERDRWKGYAKGQRADRHKARERVATLEEGIRQLVDDYTRLRALLGEGNHE